MSKYLFDNFFPVLLDIYAEVELLDHGVILCLIFLRKGHTVFHSSYTIFIPINSAHACPLLFTLRCPNSSFARFLGYPNIISASTQSPQSSNMEHCCLPSCVLIASEISSIMDAGSFTVVSLRPGIIRWTARK